METAPRHGEDGWELVEYDWRSGESTVVYERQLTNGAVETRILTRPDLSPRRRGVFGEA